MAREKSVHTEGIQIIKPYSDPSNYNFRTVRYEKRRGPSATVPDQNYTMREILNRFTSGSPINDMGVYNDFDFQEKSDMTLEESAELEVLPHPRTMDLYDRQILKEKLQNEQDRNARKSVQQRTRPNPAAADPGQAAENKNPNP